MSEAISIPDPNPSDPLLSGFPYPGPDPSSFSAPLWNQIDNTSSHVLILFSFGLTQIWQD